MGPKRFWDDPTFFQFFFQKFQKNYFWQKYQKCQKKILKHFFRKNNLGNFLFLGEKFLLGENLFLFFVRHNKKNSTKNKKVSQIIFSKKMFPTFFDIFVIVVKNNIFEKNLKKVGSSQNLFRHHKQLVPKVFSGHFEGPRIFLHFLPFWAFMTETASHGPDGFFLTLIAGCRDLSRTEISRRVVWWRFQIRRYFTVGCTAEKPPFCPKMGLILKRSS